MMKFCFKKNKLQTFVMSCEGADEAQWCKTLFDVWLMEDWSLSECLLKLS